MIHFISGEKYPSPARKNPLVNWVTSSSGSLGASCPNEWLPCHKIVRQQRQQRDKTCLRRLWEVCFLCSCMNLFLLLLSQFVIHPENHQLTASVMRCIVNLRRRGTGRNLEAELEHHMHRLLTVVEAGGARGVRLVEEGKRLCKRVCQFVHMKLTENPLDENALELACFALQLPSR